MVDVQAAPLAGDLRQAGAPFLRCALAGEPADGGAAGAPEESRSQAVLEFARAAEAHVEASAASKSATLALRSCPCPSSMSELQAAVLARKQALRATHGRLVAAMAELAEAMRRRPELGLHPEVQRLMSCSLPQDLLPLLRFGSAFKGFDTRVLLDTVSRHRIHKVTQGGAAYVLKEYAALEGLEGLRTCLQEAAVLVRARHPHVAEIAAVHVDAEERSVFIQMPFYEQGSLEEWLERERPDDLSVRRVLAQAALALAHLHGLGIVHADVKPGNIFIDRHGVARLGDFDVSVQVGARALGARRRGLTRGFAAPEIVRTGATPATDMFALGATIAAVMGEAQECEGLVQRLMAPEPAARPCARDVLGEPCLAPALAPEGDERRLCRLCMEHERQDGPAHLPGSAEIDVC